MPAQPLYESVFLTTRRRSTWVSSIRAGQHVRMAIMISARPACTEQQH